MKNPRYKVWIEQARYDLEVANISFEGGYNEWVCYQSVQCVEKSLKAVLVHAGWNPPMTHKLGVLVGLCNKANHIFSSVKLNFRKLEGYTFISRYPFVFPQQDKSPHEFINKNDAETCLKIAKGLFEDISEFLAKATEFSAEKLDLSQYYFNAEEINTKIKMVVERLVASDEITVEKIILFGSFAREKTRPRTSTMDILIVGDTKLEFIDRINYVRDLTRGSEPIIEPLVYTPKEFEDMLGDEGEGFLESAIEEGKVVYEREKSLQ